MLPAWAEKAPYVVRRATATKNSRGTEIVTWEDAETVTAALEEADDRAVVVGGARGRRVTKVAFLEGRHRFVPEKTRLVGPLGVFLVVDTLGVYEEHSELSLEQVLPS